MADDEDGTNMTETRRIKNAFVSNTLDLGSAEDLKLMSKLFVGIGSIQNTLGSSIGRLRGDISVL